MNGFDYAAATQVADQLEQLAQLIANLNIQPEQIIDILEGMAADYTTLANDIDTQMQKDMM